MGRQLKFQNFVEDGINKIIFYCEEFKSLFRCNRYGEMAELLYTVSVEGASPLYGRIYRYKDKIICVPQCADDILIYDLNTMEARFVKIEIDTWGNHHAEERGKFLSGVLYGKHLFLIGHWSTCVLKFDVEMERIVGSANLSEALGIPIDKRSICFKNAVLYHGKIMIPAYGTNRIFMIEPETMQYQKKDIPYNEGGFSDIAVTSKGIWLSPKRQGRLLRLDESMNVADAVENFPREFKWEENANFSGVVEWKGSLYAIPYKASHITQIIQDDNQNELRIEKEINSYYALLGTEKEIMKYEFAQKSNDELFIFCNESREMIVKNKRAGYRTYRYLLPEKWETECLFREAEKGEVIERQGDLKLFLSGLQTYKIQAGQEKTDDIGKKIYRYIVDESK